MNIPPNAIVSAIANKLGANLTTHSDVKLDSVELKNLEILESTFDGDVRIVVTNVADKIGPFTIIGAKEISEHTELLKQVQPSVSVFKVLDHMITQFYVFFKAGVSLKKNGDVIDVESNMPVTLYIPPWFLADEIVNRSNDTFEITNNMRVGIILHEIGHWTSESVAFSALATTGPVLGMIIFFTGIQKLIAFASRKKDDTSKKNDEIIESFNFRNFTNKSNPTLMKLYYVIFTIIGFALLVLSRNSFGSIQEAYADSIAAKMGYGSDTFSMLKFLTNRPVNMDREVYSFSELLKEFIHRLKTGYPSINWRGDILTNAKLALTSESIEFVFENEELVLENFIEKSNFLDTLISTFLQKVNNLIARIPALTQTQKFDFKKVQRKKQIKEHISNHQRVLNLVYELKRGD